MGHNQGPRDEALLKLGRNTKAICLNDRCGTKNKVPTALGITLVHDMPRRIIEGQMVPRSQVKTQKRDKPSFKRARHFSRHPCSGIPGAPVIAVQLL